MTARVDGDQHACVGHLDQAVTADEVHRLAGQPAALVVAEAAQADPPVARHPAGDPGSHLRRLCLRLGRGLRVGDFGRL